MAEEKKEEEKTSFIFKGYLTGHNGWITSLAMGSFDGKPMLISGSRDRTLIRWEINAEAEERNETIGKPLHMYKGHSHFIQDICLSQDSHYALSASWDKTVRLWNLKEGSSTRLFQGHTKDVLAVALSADNKLVLTGGRDKSLKLWTVNAENKHTIEDAHSKWISCIKFSDSKNKEIFTAGWDNEINIWDAQTLEKKGTLKAHTNFISCMAVAPRGILLGSGSKDGTVIIWNTDERAPFKILKVNKPVNCIAFSSTQPWVAVGTDSSVQIWDIKETKMFTEVVLTPHKSDIKSKQNIQVLSMCFDSGSVRLHVGCNDNHIRVYELSKDK